MRRIALLVALTVLSVVAAPLAQTSTWRPVVLSDTGMIASGHPLASEAGIRILKSGGNAVDAAVAAWAVQGLTEPEMTGLGSDMFMLIYIAKTGEVKFINGTGVAPMAANVDFYKGKGGIPDQGILSVTVPGSVAGAELAAKTYGTKPLSELLAPAVELADRGNTPLGFGDRVVQKDLANTLREIGTKGSAAFYQGPIAEKFAAYMKSEG